MRVRRRTLVYTWRDKQALFSIRHRGACGRGIGYEIRLGGCHEFGRSSPVAIDVVKRRSWRQAESN